MYTRLTAFGGGYTPTVLATPIQLNQDQESLDRRLRPRQTDYLAQWIFRKYQRGITYQMKTIVNEETILPDPHLLEFEQISVQRKQLVNALASNKQILMGIKNPDWAFVDILFFTVVSLFANNYSDIYPNSKLARMLIMSEFIVVWFLTICAISLEPDGFFKKKK